MFIRKCLPLVVAALLVSLALVNPVPVPAQERDVANSVSIRVLVPERTDELQFEGVTTKQTGDTRFFYSPPLEPGKNYNYTVKAIIKPNNYTTITRKRVITFKAGQDLEIDLRKADQLWPDEVVIRYVPTPQKVVDAMLEMGDVREGDVIYDLGCGDGRLVITGVKKFKAERGVGVDIDPQRIKESNANAKEAGVTDKVAFRQQDVLKIEDLSDATIIVLYMGDELNMALRPILWKKLRPGTRIVSHRFLMGNWKPIETKTVVGDDGDKYLLHRWVIGTGHPPSK